MQWRQRVGVAVWLLGTTMLAAASGQKPPQLIVLMAGDPAALTGAGVVTGVDRGRVSKNRAMGLSTDKSFSSGLYSAAAGTGSIESYPVDEFMYFVSGDMIMTSNDGGVVRLGKGDAVHVPRGWQGTWKTSGYVKFYVVYDVEVK